MSFADKADAERIEPLQLGRDRVDRHLVSGGQQDVFLVPAHGAWAGAVAGKCSVHHSEDARVNLLLDSQQINQSVVDHGVRPMAVAVQQATESVLHRAGDCCENMSLNRWQVDDVLSHQGFGDEDAFRVDLVQHQEGSFGAIFHPLEVLVIQVEAGYPILIGDKLMFVVAFCVSCVHHYGVIVNANQIVVSCVLQGAQDAFDLPGGG